MSELCPTCGQPVPDEPVRMTEAEAIRVEVAMDGSAFADALVDHVRNAVRDRPWPPNA